MASNELLVRQFIDTWPSLDVEAIVAHFAEDGIYHNMPMAPVQGKAQLRGFIAAFLKGWTSTAWEVRHMLSAGDLVIAERIDRIQIGGKNVELPCCGVFECRYGKIQVWRDYFDLNTYTKAIAG